ncbi:MAG: putative teichuronic acid biosynthesis glycosyltransferase TuaC [bacterium ADurb.Bin429]|nr:MAG: putative teichuronic acid biosynthesis glycosyltransferase TuaC [bacterium ADurb.Bin429]
METQPRILFLTDRYPPQTGGVGASAHRLVNGMAARGHLVHVVNLTADAEPGAVESAREDDVMVYRLGPMASLDLTLQLAENVLQYLHAHVGFNLVHGHFAVPAGYLAAYFAAHAGIASYVSIRGNDVDRGAFRADQFPFLQWTLARAGGIGCVSRELAEKCAALSGRADVQYTPNSVDAGFFEPQPKDERILKALQHREGQMILGFVGELRVKKGTAYVLDAFRAVHEQVPAALLLVGGLRSEDAAFLKRYLRQYPALRKDLHVVDYLRDREELVHYYNLMDVVLSPSLWDGMPNSVLEAMACGRVVLASNAGGIRDIITHGETGFMLDIHDLPRLGEAALELLDAGARVRDEIGRNARRHVKTHHSPETEVAQLLSLYRGVLEKRRA